MKSGFLHQPAQSKFSFDGIGISMTCYSSNIKYHKYSHFFQKCCFLEIAFLGSARILAMETEGHNIDNSVKFGLDLQAMVSGNSVLCLPGFH